MSDRIESAASESVVHAKNLSKSFGKDALYVEVFKDIQIDIKPGEQIAIVGASGSGKSTLLHCLAALEKPTRGTVIVNGKNIHKISERERSRLRNQSLGFIYQYHHLLSEFTALENVSMPLLIRGNRSRQVQEEAKVLLDRVGLAHRFHHRLGELSGGERQRVAIARGLISNPLCVFADEPTGNLDNKTATKVYDLLLELNRQHQTSFVIVTHDMSLAQSMDRVLILKDGSLSRDLV